MTLWRVSRTSPMSFDLTGKTELITWTLTFLRSTWYIKNPFLKAKINEVKRGSIFLSVQEVQFCLPLDYLLRLSPVWPWKNWRIGTGFKFSYFRFEAPHACAHVVLHRWTPYFKSFGYPSHYIAEVEQTGASSQFYDKFSMFPLICSTCSLFDVLNFRRPVCIHSRLYLCRALISMNKTEHRLDIESYLG